MLCYCCDILVIGITRKPNYSDRGGTHDHYQIPRGSPRSRPGNEHRSLQSFEAQPKAMERALAELHTVYGGAEGYAITHGVDDDIIGRLRESLLE